MPEIFVLGVYHVLFTTTDTEKHVNAIFILEFSHMGQCLAVCNALNLLSVSWVLHRYGYHLCGGGRGGCGVISVNRYIFRTTQFVRV